MLATVWGDYHERDEGVQGAAVQWEQEGSRVLQQEQVPEGWPRQLVQGLQARLSPSPFLGTKAIPSKQGVQRAMRQRETNN